MDLEASIVGNWSIRTAQTQCHLRGSRSRAWLVLKCCNCATVENERRCCLCIAFRPKPGLEFVSPGLSPVLRYPASGASLLQGGVARDTQLWRRAHAKNSLPVMGPGEITDPESIESRSPALLFAGAFFFRPIFGRSVGAASCLQSAGGEAPDGGLRAGASPVPLGGTSDGRETVTIN